METLELLKAANDEIGLLKSEIERLKAEHAEISRLARMILKFDSESNAGGYGADNYLCDCKDNDGKAY